MYFEEVDKTGGCGRFSNSHVDSCTYNSRGATGFLWICREYEIVKKYLFAQGHAHYGGGFGGFFGA
jgi:hypothetical protein